MSKPDTSAGGRWRTTHVAPPIELSGNPLTRAELNQWIRGGEVEADACEWLLATAARRRGALDLAIAEGLHALKKGDRLAQLGYHLDDYGREVLDIGETTTRKLAKLGAELRDRPLLREALRSGAVRIRAAETVLPVAVGDAEQAWVERASQQTVRQLEEAVRRERSGEDPDDEWLRLRTHLPDGERLVLDVGLELAGHVGAGRSRIERIEALAQEYLGEFAEHDDGDDAQCMRQVFSGIVPGDAPRRARLERETDRWATLPKAAEIGVPDVHFEDIATAQEVDERLRQLAAMRESWEKIIGWCAHVVRRSGMASLLGFATFRHYLEERLGLPARAVEQREQLERRLWASPALREAQRQKVSYEKLRVLSRLQEREIGEWTPRAHALTCIELRRQVEGERERQMRVARKLVVSMPRRIAVLLAAALQVVRRRMGRLVPLGKCMAILAGHFLETWKHGIQPARTRAQKVRERDAGCCQVPGCSHAADHSHHVEFRSHGGSDDLENQVAVCAFHHQRCIHGGYLRVTGEAPAGLKWWLRGRRWKGGVVPADDVS